MFNDSLWTKWLILNNFTKDDLQSKNITKSYVWYSYLLLTKFLKKSKNHTHTHNTPPLIYIIWINNVSKPQNTVQLYASKKSVAFNWIRNAFSQQNKWQLKFIICISRDGAETANFN